MNWELKVLNLMVECEGWILEMLIKIYQEINIFQLVVSQSVSLQLVELVLEA